MKKLAVLILTYNEEKNIVDCIKSASFADEIIVIDSGSRDRTAELATSSGARVIVHPMDAGFAAQRNFAQSQTDAEWVFFLDADERITQELAEEVTQVLQKKSQKAYWIQRRTVFMGQAMHHGGYKPDYVMRLFPNKDVVWTGVVHEQADTKLPTAKLKYPADHYTNASWEQYFTKFNQYTTLMAEKMAEKGKKTDLFRMQAHAFYAFFHVYVLQRGFLDGKQGFILAVFHYFYTLTKYVKLDYLQKGK